MSKLNAYPLKQVHTDLFELVATIEGVGDKLYVENRMGWSVTVCVFLSVAGVKQ